VRDKFKELKASLKIHEQTIKNNLKKNMFHLENQFKIIRDMPNRLFEDSDKWIKIAKIKLDKFMQNSENKDYIAFDMLEERKARGDDIIA